MPPKPARIQHPWQALEWGMFCHFSINTLSELEQNGGTFSPAMFNPTDLDVRQWVATAQQAGLGYVILNAKHHDGFCLWPTATTHYSIANSPYQDGHGDIVGELAAACREAGLPLGLYLSPWDRHEPCYADATAYEQFYIRQLTELCTRYGPLRELWFDGAGSTRRGYDWVAIMAVVDLYQPQAAVFNLGHPTIRWVGNEDDQASGPASYVDGYSVTAEAREIIASGVMIGHTKIHAFPLQHAPQPNAAVSRPHVRLSSVTAYPTEREQVLGG